VKKKRHIKALSSLLSVASSRIHALEQSVKLLMDEVNSINVRAAANRVRAGSDCKWAQNGLDDCRSSLRVTK
jgi:hypothetical protein